MLDVTRNSWPVGPMSFKKYYRVHSTDMLQLQVMLTDYQCFSIRLEIDNRRYGRLYRLEETDASFQAHFVLGPETLDPSIFYCVRAC
jgi:hypothetical protein